MRPHSNSPLRGERIFFPQFKTENENRPPLRGTTRPNATGGRAGGLHQDIKTTLLFVKTLSSYFSLAYDLDGEISGARPVVKIYQNNLLPGS